MGLLYLFSKNLQKLPCSWRLCLQTPIAPRHLRDFSNIFQPNISEDQKKSYYLRAGLLDCAIWQIRRWLLHCIHEKFRWEHEVATFRTKTFDFTLIIRLNWLEKIELMGCAGPPGILFIVNYRCTRILLYAKMLKGTENEETRLFWQIFIIGGIFIEAAGPPGPAWLRL